MTVGAVGSSKVHNGAALQERAAPPSVYTVQKGDTMTGIAVNHNVSFAALKVVNPQIRNTSLIFPGDKVNIPSNQATSYTVQHGDTLSKIATKNETTVAALDAANPQIRNINRIYPGDVLNIPNSIKTVATGDSNSPKSEVGSTSASTDSANVAGIRPDDTSVRAADYARNHVLSGSIGKCYAYVKRALQATGAVNIYLEGVAAKGAGPQLEKQGFVNVLGKPGANIRSPYDAPTGAVLVYGAAPGATDKNAKYGHIEIRTKDGFASDYFSQRARTGDASVGLDGRGRVLIGVYIKPAPGSTIPSGETPSTTAQPATTDAAVSASKNELITKLGSVITIGEGNYNSYNTGTKGVKDDKVGYSFVHPKEGTVTNKTINDIIATEGLTGNDRNRMFATGKYQTTIGTLKLAKEAMNLTGNEKYTPEMQERVFREFLIDKAGGGVLAAFIKEGKGTVDQAQYAAAKEWASIGVPKGYKNKYDVVSNGNLSYYQKEGQNAANSKATQELRTLLISIDKSR